MDYSMLIPVIAGLINQGQGQPTINTGGLSTLIGNNQNTNNQLINNMPAAVQQLLQQYQATTNNAYGNATTGTNAIGNNLLNQTQNLYGPNAPAVQATLAALKQQDYSTQPGTINALKANLAATGGLQRGGAANAITKATLAPAQQFSQQAANTQGQQLQAQQSNVQQALNKIASMDDATLQQVLGMTQQQAQQILQSGNQATQTQLADLINSNNLATNQNINVAGLNANNQYQNQVAQNAGQSAIVNGLTNLGVQGAGLLSGAMTAGNGGGTAFPQGDTTVNPALPNPASSVPGYGTGSVLNLY
jgi:hypothetical protein